jgi:phosphoglycerate dehydrogenase-like enzyme
MPLVGPEVTVCNARGAHNIPTAEWVAAAVFAMVKFFPLYYEIQRSGVWKRRNEVNENYRRIKGDNREQHPQELIEELTEKKILLVGYGAIAQEIERMLSPYRPHLVRGARRARTEPMVHPVSELASLLPEAEIVILLLPLTPESHGLLGKRQLSLMRQGAILVNAGRGPLVDTDA